MAADERIRIRIRLQPKQRQLWKHLETGTASWVGYGGARGSAKSHGIDCVILLRALKYSGTIHVIFRRVYKDLLDNHIEPMLARWPVLKGWYNKTDSMIRLPNGSSILFRAGENLKDVEDVFQGKNYCTVAVDEASKLTEYELHEVIKPAVRYVGQHLIEAVLICAMNPGGLGHCIPHGEVLTPDGWKDIRMFSVGDPVYTVQQDGELIATTVDQVHAHQYEGKLREIKARGLYILGTPDHRVAKLGGNRSEWRKPKKFTLTKLKDLPGQASIMRQVGWKGTLIKRFFLPEESLKAKKRKRFEQPMELLGDDYCELMGWFLSEGHIVRTQYKFGISQMKARQRQEINTMLLRLGFHFRTNRTGFLISSPEWQHYLSRFGKCRDKWVPSSIKNAPPHQLRKFFKAAMDGDGHWTGKDSGQYYTISRQLADDMAEICIKIGYCVYVSSNQQRDREGLRYIIAFHRKKSGGQEILTGNHRYKVSSQTKRRTRIRDIDFNGPVYCIGIKGTESFVVRQNGSVWISGNSFLKRIFIKRDFRKNEMPEDYVFLQGYGWDNFEWVRKALTKIGISYQTYYYKWTDRQRFQAFVKLSSYGRNLYSLPENRRKAFLYGDWDIFSGQFFDTWQDSIHVVKTSEYERPESATITSAIDYGQKCVMEVQATERSGRTVNFLEVFTEHMDPWQRATACANALLEHQLYRIDMVYDTDMAINPREYSGFDKSIQSIFDETFEKIMGKDKMPRTRIVQKSSTDRRGYRISVNLAVRSALAWSIDKEGKLSPPIVQVTDTCPELINCIKNLIEDDKVLDMADFVHTNDVVDHPFDAFKMAYMETMTPPELEKKITAQDKFEMDRLASLGELVPLAESWEDVPWQEDF